MKWPDWERVCGAFLHYRPYRLLSRHREPGSLMRRILDRIVVTLGLVLTGAPALAETYYVAPLGAVIAGTPDGTEALPFPSLNAAFASDRITGGDTILLKEGNYGDVDVRGKIFDTPVTIASQIRRTAHLDSLLIAGGSRNLTFERLSVWPSDPAKGKLQLVRAYADTSDIKVERFTIMAAADGADFMSWDAATWEARQFDGILLQGPRSQANRNLLTAVNFGVSIAGADSKALRNTVNGFNGDGLRGLGDNNVLRFNKVFNCVATNGNHDDGFQSFAGPSGSVRNLMIDSNTIVEWNGAADHPLRCALQGIGLFDGFYDDLVITNNLIVTTNYNGLAVAGARGARIVNNTVVNGRGLTSQYPWLRIGSHKNGTPSSDTIVANNLAMSFQGAPSTQQRVEFRDNSVIGTPGAVFENAFAFDYRPKTASGFIDTADAAMAPLRDVMNQKRPGGAAPDRGAYERQVGVVSASTQQLLITTEDAAAVGTTSTTTTDTTGAKRITAP